jgi:heme/copper-type cytochrome/quinol oxidase subunit 2
MLGLWRTLLVAGFATLTTASNGAGAANPAPRRIDVVVEGHFGHFVPTVIKATYGDTIHVTLKAMDSAHGFKVEGKNFDITGYPGMPAEVKFVADWIGGREWFCTFDCGPQHGTMTGMIVVTRD